MKLKAFNLMIIFILVITNLTACGYQPSGDSINPVVLGTKSGDYSQTRYSPDGKHIAFTLQNRLYVMESSGKHIQRITGSLLGPDPDINALSWISKDEIAYVSDNSKDFIANSSLRSYNILTHKKKIIKAGLHATFHISWNPIHQNLVAIDMNSNKDISSGEELVYILNINDGTLTPIPNVVNATQIFWLPDGEHLLAVTEKEYLKININTMKRVSINKDPSVESINICKNDKIIYRKMGSGSNKYVGGMYISNLNLKEEPKKLVDIDMVSYDCSPDGKTIVYTTVGGIGYNELKLYHLK